jgi:biopolymer transport protein ExbB/TolQ
LSWLLLALGLLGTLYDSLNIWLAVQMTHPTHFNVVAPSLSEALLPLGLSLVTAIVATLLNRPSRAVASA